MSLYRVMEIGYVNLSISEIVRVTAVNFLVREVCNLRKLTHQNRIILQWVLGHSHALKTSSATIIIYSESHNLT